MTATALICGVDFRCSGPARGAWAASKQSSLDAIWADCWEEQLQQQLTHMALHQVVAGNSSAGMTPALRLEMTVSGVRVWAWAAFPARCFHCGSPSNIQTIDADQLDWLNNQCLKPPAPTASQSTWSSSCATHHLLDSLHVANHKKGAGLKTPSQWGCVAAVCIKRWQSEMFTTKPPVNECLAVRTVNVWVLNSWPPP